MPRLAPKGAALWASTSAERSSHDLFGLMASLAAAYLPFHPYALASGGGAGSASMATAAVGSLSPQCIRKW